jgi:hypothetical protein
VEKMTKGFPAICVKHPNILIYNRNGIAKHREHYSCYARIMSIHSKAYRKWKEKQAKKKEE